MKLIACGECMLELLVTNPGSIQPSFGGDTFNALVYAKRIAPELTVSLLTAVAKDNLSAQMKKFWRSHGVNDDLAITTEHSSIGIYAISTDADGERQFQYWRANSAASQLMQFASEELLLSLIQGAKLFFFTGISLAILSDTDKALFFQLLKQIKQQGVTIAFDPNYRGKMWQGKQHAIFWLEAAYQIADIVLPGLEDHQQLFGHQTVEQVMRYLHPFQCEEVIIKAGKLGVYGYHQQELLHHQQFEPAIRQKDTTAAGDSFAGVYLAARLTHCTMANAIEKACNVARHVVQHSGAITPLTEFQQHQF